MRSTLFSPVRNVSPCQRQQSLADDQTQPFEMTPGFKPFTVSPSSGNFLMRKTYISAISFSTAAFFQVFSPLLLENLVILGKKRRETETFEPCTGERGEESGNKCKQAEQQRKFCMRMCGLFRSGQSK